MSNLVEIKKQLANPNAMGQFKLALPIHISPEKFQRVAMTALLNSDISLCTPPSVMNALMKCAQDGLLPDGREAAIVKYGQVATYMPMVYGLIKRMRNSGDVKSVNAHIVYEKDKFDYIIENGMEKFTHKPSFEVDRGAKLMAYAVIVLDDGTPHVEVMMKADIDKVRKASKAPNSPAWSNWEEEMWKKAVIRRAAKRVPTSSDVEKLLHNDMRVAINGTSDEEDGDKTQSLIESINNAIDTETSEPLQGEILPPQE